jgi:hypothetical protein
VGHAGGVDDAYLFQLDRTLDRQLESPYSHPCSRSTSSCGPAANPSSDIDMFAVTLVIGRPYGVSRCASRGNAVTSRTLAAPTRRATNRSSPIAKPPCGGIPYRKVST